MKSSLKSTNWGVGGVATLRPDAVRKPAKHTNQALVYPVNDSQQAAAAAWKENYKRDCMQIDASYRSDNPTISKPKNKETYSWQKAGSINDFLADNPRLCAAYKRRGEVALDDFFAHREWDLF